MNGWISVKEKLPIQWQRVLTTGIQPKSTSGTIAYRWYADDCFVDGEFTEHGQPDFWQPWPSIEGLPEPSP